MVTPFNTQEVKMPAAATTSVKLDAEMKSRVQKIAASQRRSSHWIMREAITQYVDRVEWQSEFDRAALESLEEFERTGLHLTHDEVDAWLAKLEAGEDVPPPECHT
jgi:predicted transcriptional regulator